MLCQTQPNAADSVWFWIAQGIAVQYQVVVDWSRYHRRWSAHTNFLDHTPLYRSRAKRQLFPQKLPPTAVGTWNDLEQKKKSIVRCNERQRHCQRDSRWGKPTSNWWRRVGKCGDRRDVVKWQTERSAVSKISLTHYTQRLPGGSSIIIWIALGIGTSQ